MPARQAPKRVGWDPADSHRRETINLFGAGRGLFGSNFPIEKLWSSYGELIQAYRTALVGYPVGTPEKMFSTTARRVYRI